MDEIPSKGTARTIPRTKIRPVLLMEARWPGEAASLTLEEVCEATAASASASRAKSYSRPQLSPQAAHVPRNREAV